MYDTRRGISWSFNRFLFAKIRGRSGLFIVSWYITIFILLFTALAKMLLLLERHPFLVVQDPILFFLNERVVLAISTRLEWLVLAVLVSFLPWRIKGAFLYSLGWLFLAYHSVFLFLYGEKHLSMRRFAELA